jgi:hypothetical protein
MKTAFSIAIALILLGCTSLAAPSVHAQAQDDNAKIMEGLYTKIAQSLTVGTNTPAAGKSILILANPGIAIDPALNPAASQDDRRAISRVLDRVPGPSWIYQETTFSISSVYGNILQNHELPDPKITAKQKQDLQAVDVTLFKNGDPANGESDKLKAYKNYRATYQDAVNAVEVNRAANGSVPPKYIQARQGALQDWQNLGFKNEIETDLAKRDSLTSLDPNFWFQQLSNAYTVFQESPGTPDQFEPVGLYPAYASWSTLKGWATITLSADEIHNLSTSDHTSVGGSVGVGYGLFSFNAGASHDTTDQHTHSNVKVSNIKMELLRVSIDRSWLEGLIFRSKIWRWSQDAPLGSKLISDGATPPGSNTTDVIMPYVPTAILVSRNVEISGQVSDVDTTFHNDHTSASGSLGWGPFAIGGHYEEDHTRNTFDAKIDANGITIPGYQIIGWYCEVLPKSPDPDLVNYKWPSKP